MRYILPNCRAVFTLAMQRHACASGEIRVQKHHHAVDYFLRCTSRNTYVAHLPSNMRVLSIRVWWVRC